MGRKSTIDPSKFEAGVVYESFTIVGVDPDRKKHVLCDCECGKKGVSVNQYQLLNGSRKSCGCRRKPVEIPPGTKFGRYTVVGPDPERRQNMICTCDCDGHETSVFRYSLLDGHSTSCGCSRALPEIRPGDVFERLTVVEKDDERPHFWKCRCSCDGKVISVRNHHLVSGHTTSCSCRQKEVVGDMNRTHGHSKRTREYESWTGMIQRTTNPNNAAYPDYGGRGIRVCDDWRYSFETFFDYVGPCPSDEHSIDRYPDVNGNYEPGNVRWATVDEQALNKRTTVWIDFRGFRRKLAEVADEHGIPREMAYSRNLRGWTPEEIVGIPPGQRRKPGTSRIRRTRS